ncbi:MAG TPA: hypothetical protein PKM73_00690 [Verrucomicrobiota bacterium]|nr:hypothetical protein [Verrucomicrobiota bacterium]HNU49859.1 hypothetical protein [Verrucomicrobiota bacterium]
MSNPVPASGPSANRGRRACPATGGFISPADCGASRGSRLECPVDCPFFPFGTHPDAPYARASDSLFRKIDACLAEAGKRDVINANAIRLQSKIPDADALGFLLALTQLNHESFFLMKDGAGQTPADRWAADRWRGLNNDERQLVHWRRNSRPTVLEVESAPTKDGIQLCRDLLDPEQPLFPLVMSDFLSPLVRFSRLFGWIEFMPRCARTLTPVLRVEFPIWRTWRATLDERWQAARKANPELTLSDYLRTHFVAEVALIHKLHLEEDEKRKNRREAAACFTEFRLTRGRAPVEAILATKPELEREVPDPAALDSSVANSFTWQCEGESAAYLVEPDVHFALDPLTAYPIKMGYLQLTEGWLLLAGLGLARQEFAKRLLARWLGDLIEIAEDRCANLDGSAPEFQEQRALLSEATADIYGTSPQPTNGADESETEEAGEDAGDDPYDDGLEPPTLDSAGEPAVQPVTEPEGVDGRMLAVYRRFLETPLADLGGVTPRAAAGDPARRPLLVDLMKEHLRLGAARGRSSQMLAVLHQVLAELGLEELRNPSGTPS